MNLAAGYVYFIGQAGTGLVKIGASGVPLRRLTALRAASPVPLVLLGSIPSDDCLHAERMLHHRFRASRHHGEWFERTPDLLALIDSCRNGSTTGRLSATEAARVVTLVEAGRALGCTIDAIRKRAQRMQVRPVGRCGNASLFRLGDLS